MSDPSVFSVYCYVDKCRSPCLARLSLRSQHFRLSRGSVPTGEPAIPTYLPPDSSSSPPPGSSFHVRRRAAFFPRPHARTTARCAGHGPLHAPGRRGASAALRRAGDTRPGSPDDRASGTELPSLSATGSGPGDAYFGGRVKGRRRLAIDSTTWRRGLTTSSPPARLHRDIDIGLPAFIASMKYVAFPGSQAAAGLPSPRTLSRSSSSAAH